MLTTTIHTFKVLEKLRQTDAVLFYEAVSLARNADLEVSSTYARSLRKWGLLAPAGSMNATTREAIIMCVDGEGSELRLRSWAEIIARGFTPAEPPPGEDDRTMLEAIKAKVLREDFPFPTTTATAAECARAAHYSGRRAPWPSNEALPDNDWSILAEQLGRLPVPNESTRFRIVFERALAAFDKAPEGASRFGVSRWDDNTETWVLLPVVRLLVAPESIGDWCDRHDAVCYCDELEVELRGAGYCAEVRPVAEPSDEQRSVPEGDEAIVEALEGKVRSSKKWPRQAAELRLDA